MGTNGNMLLIVWKINPNNWAESKIVIPPIPYLVGSVFDDTIKVIKCYRYLSQILPKFNYNFTVSFNVLGSLNFLIRLYLVISYPIFEFQEYVSSELYS